MKAVVESIPAATAFVEERLEALSFPMKAVMQVNVAMDELLSNVVNYAYPGGGGDITVCFDFHEDTAAITLTDSGESFDPLKQDDPDVSLSAEERGVGGLGIYLVKKTMDKIEYRREDGKNILTICKRRTPAVKKEDRG